MTTDIGKCHLRTISVNRVWYWQIPVDQCVPSNAFKTHTLVNVLSNQKPEHPCSPSTPQPPLPNPSTLSLIFDLFLHEDIVKKEGLLASKWKEISAYLDWWNEWSFQECPLFTPTGIKVCFIYLWMSPMAFAHSFSPLFAGANWSRQWRCLRIGFLHSPSKLECVCRCVVCLFVCRCVYHKLFQGLFFSETVWSFPPNYLHKPLILIDDD